MYKKQSRSLPARHSFDSEDSLFKVFIRLRLGGNYRRFESYVVYLVLESSSGYGIDVMNYGGRVQDEIDQSANNTVEGE